MKRAAWIAATLVVAVVFHVFTVRAYPFYVMVKLAAKNSSSQAPNQIVHKPLPTEDSRLVVRPSPDLLYSACSYNIIEAPLRISAKVPDTYWSVSIFAANTDNFFVVNDRQIEGDRVHIILAAEGTPHSESQTFTMVEAPTPLGVVIFRMLVTDRDRIDEFIEIQKQAECESVEF